MKKSLQPPKEKLSAKIILVGSSSVGKTSILKRYIDNEFSNTLATIGIDFKTKTVQIEGSEIKMQIWDTSGQEQFKSMAPSYFKGSIGAFFVFDVTNSKSFEQISSWIEQCVSNAGPDVIKIILANKCDIVEDRKVTKDRIETLADKMDAQFFETSAKNATNIEKAFEKMARDIKTRIGNKRGSNDPNTSKGNISLVDKSQIQDQEQENKGGCCTS